MLAREFDRIYERISGSESTSPPSDTPPALTRLQHLFGLSPFECDVLLFCAGAVVDSRFAATTPTFGLAYSSLVNPHWSALSRLRPLRYWRLVEMERGPLLAAPLRIDERILDYLIGLAALDERLEPVIHPIEETQYSEIERRVLAGGEIAQGARFWRSGSSEKPLVLVAHPGSSALAVFREICRETALRPFEMNAADLPQAPLEREELARLWMREAALGGCALLLHADDDSLRALERWLPLIRCPVAVEVKSGTPGEQLDGLLLHLMPLSDRDRREFWNEHLGDVAPRMNGALERIVEYFHFDQSAIAVSASAARDALLEDESADPGRTAWQICRRHARRSLENLARRIEPRATWSDLILPKPQIETLRQIAIHVRRRAIVNNQWGFAERYSRGIGLSALFSGQSGTGKTMAAEVIAAELDLDLYCIDLASVVSKYIGETEKNLRRLFDAADESGCILLFDEADALFGKRSEVRDSHDRYANLEISYLLQRVEAYRGVAILTTNMQHAIDPAFMRRLRFIVHFPFPDAAARAEIWRRVFPPATPIANLDFSLLAQLNVSGGVIRNIATHAAFLAADEGGGVTPAQVLAAARSEYAKLDRPLTPAETRGVS